MPIDIPMHLPDDVAQAYKEAAQAQEVKLFSAACAQYRRCLELGLKRLAPEIEAWKIEKRIDKLAAENRITVELKEWAHQLRIDGNEAIHGDASADDSLAQQMQNLTKFLLIYLYTLPGQIAAAKNVTGVLNNS